MTPLLPGSFLRFLASRFAVRCLAGMGLVGSLSVGADSTARAQSTATLTTLYTFTGGSDGAGPNGLVQGHDGNFYATAAYGGANNKGTVFRITAAGALTTLHSFNGSDGSSPIASLVQSSDGNFYGTAPGSTSIDVATVFRITPAGVLTTLHTFSGSYSGRAPEGSLVQSPDGNFYGTTPGASGVDGTVFRITPAGVLTTLYSFPAREFDEPNGLVQGSDGNFYGTTFSGGSSGNGSVFRVTPAGVLTTLYSFTAGADGQLPVAALVQGSDGNFYGTTRFAGGGGGGTVFRITPAGELTTLYSFTGGSDGGAPGASLVQGTDGNFYGSTSPVGGAGRHGTIFRITPTGSLTTLYTFSGGDGDSPGSLVQGSDGNFYGSAFGGGDNNKGTIFRLTIPGNHPTFFTGEVALGGGVNYLAFPNGSVFGYYSFYDAADLHFVYHYDLGFEYVLDANDGGGVYLYDFASDTFWYTSPTFSFPYLYDFKLRAFLYYYPDPDHAGHYNTDGVRVFYNLTTGETLVK